MKTKNLENFQKLVSKDESGWLDKFLNYKTNKKWLDNSSKVALNVLEALKDKKMSQKDLALKMNVSAQQINKIVKGKQNLTFETIAKIEEALDISLLQIYDYKSINEIETKEAIIQAVQETISDEIFLGKLKSMNFSEKFDKKHASMKIVYNVNKQLVKFQPNYQKAVI